MARQGKPLMDIETAKKVPQILADNFFNKTFTESLFKISQAMSQPERYASNLAGILNPVVPSAVAQVAQLQDPTKRVVAEGLMSPVNALKARIPGLRETLPADINIFGQPKQQVMSTTEGILGKTPITGAVEAVTGEPGRTAIQTPAQQLLMNPYLTTGDIKGKIKGVELTPQQEEVLKRDVGGTIYNVLNQIGSNESFTKVPRPMQAKIVANIFTKFRTAGSLKMMGEIMANEEQKAQFFKNIMKMKGLQQDTGE
jgi:hypothetical protein